MLEPCICICENENLGAASFERHAAREPPLHDIPEGVRLARSNGEKLGSRFPGAVMDLEHACLHKHVLLRARTLSEFGASSSQLACQSMMLWHITPAAQVR